MGAVADAALAAGGQVIGVIPQSLVDREIAHLGLTELHVVHTMHERKMRMADASDAFIALPGGFGTLEEFFEVVTWNQLGIYSKPSGLLNVEGFYDEMLAMLDHGVNEQFIRPAHRSSILSSDDPAKLLTLLRGYEPTATSKWIGRQER